MHPFFGGKSPVPRVTRKTRITEKTKIPERPKNNREILIGALVYILNSAILYSGKYREVDITNKNLKSLFQNYK